MRYAALISGILASIALLQTACSNSGTPLLKMESENVLVDTISSVSPPTTPAVGSDQTAPRFVTVQFQGGRSGRLDMGDPRSAAWAGVLDSLRRSNEPAYVEIDPATNVITQLLAPLTVSVGALTPTADGNVEVELVISQARHYLRRSNPRFQDLLNALQSAQKQGTQVWVTESPAGDQIIDVRPRR